MNVEDIKTKFARHSTDRGSPEVQIALATYHIRRLTQHLKSFAKDHQAKRGLIGYVNKRKKMYRYLKNNQPSVAESILKNLTLKKI